LYDAYQYGNINEDLNFLSEDEKKTFKYLINEIIKIVKTYKKEFSYEDLVKIFEIIEL